MRIGDIVRYKNCSKGGELAMIIYTYNINNWYSDPCAKLIWIATGNTFKENLNYMEVVND